MCWIMITRFKNVSKTLEAQQERWLHSLWLINLTHRTVYKCVRAKVEEYQEYLNDIEEKTGLVICHHRNASVWKINMDNCHPFYDKKYALMQNWTSKAFYAKHKDTYKKDTDSETLFRYLRENTTNLQEAVKELDAITDNLWIIILVDIEAKQVLIYADWSRESWIKIQNGYMKEYSNFEPWKDRWYKNIWYIIIDFEWKVIEKKFEEKLNTEDFYTRPTKTTRSWYSNYDWDRWEDEYYENTYRQLSLNNTYRYEIYNSWLSNNVLQKLYRNRVYKYDDILQLTVKDLIQYWLTVEERRDVEELVAMFWEIIDTWYEDKYKPEHFYSEEILNDDWLLYNDLLCFMYRSKAQNMIPTLQRYAYENMGIEYNESIKKVVGKKNYKRMRRLFTAWEKTLKFKQKNKW